MSYYAYWGKWGGEPNRAHLLAYHCLDVAATFRAYLDSNQAQADSLLSGLGSRETAIKWLTWLVCLHDLGKFPPTFQSMVPEAVAQVGGASHSASPVPARHDELGFWAWTTLGVPEELEDIIAPLVIASMGHHGYPVGGGGTNLGPYLRSGQMFPPEVLEDIRTFATTTRDVIGVPIDWPGLTREGAKRSSFLVAGLAVLADWIGSNETFFPRQIEVIPLEDYWRSAQEKASAALMSVGVHRGKSKGFMDFQQQFQGLAHPTPLQKAAGEVTLSVEAGPQVLILESLTGDGKTEAAMRLTHRLMAAGLADGFYLALPTMATSNAMYERLCNVFLALYENPSGVSCVLAHGAKNIHQGFRASIFEMSSDEARPMHRRGSLEEATPAGARCNAWLADSSKKALLAQCGIGTIDQAMLAVMKAKHQSLRLLGLHRKVLIVDEVHANDAYMHEILQRLLEFHAAGGGSAILMSATLPKEMRQELVSAFLRGLGTPLAKLNRSEYPLLTQAGALGVLELPVGLAPGRARSVKVIRVGDPAEAKQILLEAARQGKCGCWVRNTVREATESFGQIRGGMEALGMPSEKALLFHARFAMADRLAIEEKVTRLFGKESGGELRAGRILVATQVVEQSLDIDFDVMVTDLAPVDLVIQRAGRLHRHRRHSGGNPIAPSSGSDAQDERGDAVLHVLAPDPDSGPIEKGWVWAFSGGTAMVYPDHTVLWRGLTLLLQGGGFRMPEDARHLIEGVYGEGAIEAPASLGPSEQRVEIKESRDQAFAMQNVLNRADGYHSRQEWASDAVSPTRLGEAVTTVRLACWDGQRLTPWGLRPSATPNYMPWAMAEVKMARRQLCRPVPPSGGPAQKALEALLASLPDHGDWTPVMVLERISDDSWGGCALDDKGEIHSWTYNAQYGLVKAV